MTKNSSFTSAGPRVQGQEARLVHEFHVPGVEVHLLVAAELGQVGLHLVGEDRARGRHMLRPSPVGGQAVEVEVVVAEVLGEHLVIAAEAAGADQGGPGVDGDLGAVLLHGSHRRRRRRPG